MPHERAVLLVVPARTDHAHHLVIATPVDVTGQGVVDQCDEATERCKKAGRAELHGILYLHAAQPSSS